MIGDIWTFGIYVLAVIGASAILANFIPSPADISNPVLRFLSRIIHLIAAQLSIATAPK